MTRIGSSLQQGDTSEKASMILGSTHSILAMPISWKGTLAQYVGRLHRQHDGKTEVLVFDYVDEQVAVLARMAAKRRTGYRALGYSIE